VVVPGCGRLGTLCRVTAPLRAVLSESQLATLAAVGEERTAAAGDVLYTVGDLRYPFIAILEGEAAIVDGAGNEIIRYGPSGFLGEISLLTGQTVYLTALVIQPLRYIAVDRDALRQLLFDDAPLSELLLSTFMARRESLQTIEGIGVEIVGPRSSEPTRRMVDFARRNRVPYTWRDPEHSEDATAAGLIEGLRPDELPLVRLPGGTELRAPSMGEVSRKLGIGLDLAAREEVDLVVIGGGPAGLGAAVYGASEGLDVLVIESNSPGGQAGSSSKIENYLGFPTGISGQELAGAAYAQAQKFGADVMIARNATHLTCDRKPYAIEIDGASRISARAVIIATGAQYRRPLLDNAPQFEGNGIYYGATFVESQLCGGEEVIIVGGGNSAGQAAVFLAATARRVYMLVRAAGLADSMSRYLIRRIEENPLIELRTCTEIVGLEGDGHLERVRWTNLSTGESETRPISHLFMMTGAVPNTQWLKGCVALDDKGFIRTGPDLTRDDLSRAAWPLPRTPGLLETSLPGVFAVGDVRYGNIKRVASAVGEGSIAISLVHQFRQE
jgi:thioredoxin reductase (NADPH)